MGTMSFGYGSSMKKMTAFQPLTDSAKAGLVESVNIY